MNAYIHCEFRLDDGHSIAFNMFLLCDTVTLTFCPNTKWVARTIPVASLVIVVSAVLVVLCGQTHTHRHDELSSA